MTAFRNIVGFLAGVITFVAIALLELLLFTSFSDNIIIRFLSLPIASPFIIISYPLAAAIVCNSICTYTKKDRKPGMIALCALIFLYAVLSVISSFFTWDTSNWLAEIFQLSGWLIVARFTLICVCDGGTLSINDILD